jgi:glycerol kinase
MAAISEGLCSDDDFFKSREIAVTFDPHMSASERQTRLDRWHLAVAQCIGFSS